MSRKRIPQQTETEVLLNCRRRCCICFGLDRDHRIKQGQIAHLDHDNSNHIYDNLAFLCLNHHDHYDTRTSQSKNLTVNEIKNYKTELEYFINDNWNKPIIDSETIRIDIFTGSYSRGNEFVSSELEVTYLGGNKIHVKGEALWGINREYGPNIGQLDFVSEININKAVFLDKLFEDEYKLELEFLGDRLLANEKHVTGYFGMNASFGGEYYKRE